MSCGTSLTNTTLKRRSHPKIVRKNCIPCLCNGKKNLRNLQALRPDLIEESNDVSKKTYPLKLPESLKREAQRLAKEDGVSLNHWISVAVAQKIGAVETAAEFLKRRAAGANPADLKRFLRAAPDVPPMQGDELP
jgi:hypothetical protein